LASTRAAIRTKPSCHEQRTLGKNAWAIANDCIEVRDGKIADVGYHPPFDLLFSSSEFEYGDLVGLTCQHPNPGWLVDGPEIMIRAVRKRCL
jgi:hypothetical protein